MSNVAVSEPEQHPNLWFDDVLHVENTLFRVHKSSLCRQSVVFRMETRDRWAERPKSPAEIIRLGIKELATERGGFRGLYAFTSPASHVVVTKQ